MGQSVAVVHSFKQELRYSESASDETFWSEVYHKAFPNLVNMMSCPGDVQSQRMGIDRVLLLSNGVIIKIDEKKRRSEYNDILIEYLSNDKTNAPGWIAKDLTIDYLAYAFMLSRRCYLFDWPMLRKAWCCFGQEWLKQYKHIEAKNVGYTTHSLAIPVDALLKALDCSRIIQL